MKMISKNIKLCFILLAGFICFQLPSYGFAEEKAMQDKYGYALMDVPAEAKQAYYEEHEKNWEDSIYSERLFFLEQWEIETEKEKLRKGRLNLELERQKEQEELKLQKKDLEKQKKLQIEQAEALKKQTKKEKDKIRLDKKYNSLFEKMDKMRNKQLQRGSGHNNGSVQN